jgi:hypothetical protein
LEETASGSQPEQVVLGRPKYFGLLKIQHPEKEKKGEMR